MSIPPGQVRRRAGIEFLGTALLLPTLFGAHHLATLLPTRDDGVLWFAPVAVVVVVLTVPMVRPTSGAHLNPSTTLATRVLGGRDNGSAWTYIVAQLTGASTAAVLGHCQPSPLPHETLARMAGYTGLTVAVDTFGLVLVPSGVLSSALPIAAMFAVSTYLGGASFVTGSLSFANPPLLISRALVDPGAPLPIAAIATQCIGGLLAAGAVWLLHLGVGAATRCASVPFELARPKARRS